MEAFIIVIVKVKIFSNVLNSLPNGFIVVKIDSFIFHGTPEALYENVIQGSARPSMLIVTPASFKVPVKASLVNWLS